MMRGLRILPALVLVLTGCANLSGPPASRPGSEAAAPAQTNTPGAPDVANAPLTNPASTPPVAPSAPLPNPSATPSPAALTPLARLPLQGAQYAGRISVTIQSEPQQHLNAEVELTGDATQGELKVYGPFGSLLAILQWQPERAVLIEGERRRTVKNIDWLIERVTGAPLPVALIFDWLAGRPVRNDDWSVEPRTNPQAPLRATRLQPLPRIELILALKPAVAP